LSTFFPQTHQTLSLYSGYSVGIPLFVIAINNSADHSVFVQRVKIFSKTSQAWHNKQTIDSNNGISVIDLAKNLFVYCKLAKLCYND
jgi:hypothetical protein